LGLFAVRAKKLRERIDSAACEANTAAQISLQKTAIATARLDHETVAHAVIDMPSLHREAEKRTDFLLILDRNW